MTDKDEKKTDEGKDIDWLLKTVSEGVATAMRDAEPHTALFEQASISLAHTLFFQAADVADADGEEDKELHDKLLALYQQIAKMSRSKWQMGLMIHYASGVFSVMLLAEMMGIKRPKGADWGKGLREMIFENLKKEATDTKAWEAYIK